MPEIATVAHLSDLHFIADLTEESRRQWSKTFGTKSHSYNKLKALSRKFFEIQEVEGKEIDILLVTGDVTTDGSEDSLNTSLDYLQRDDVYSFPRRPDAQVGLAIDLSQRLIIPGNHDRYAGGLIPLQQPSKKFEKVYPPHASYPYAIGYRRTNAESTNPNVPAVIFFVLDSTLNQKGRADWWNRVARGRIEQEVCDQIEILAQQIRKNGQVPSFTGQPLKVNYDIAIRIAVLHHHPITSRQSYSLMDDFELTVLENSRSFIDACFNAEIDLVLFGHQHRKYEGAQARQEIVGPDKQKTYTLATGDDEFFSNDASIHQMRFFCCPSTSEYSEIDNGFQIFDFDRARYTVQSYIWNGNKDWRGDSFNVSDSTPYNYSRGKLQKFASAR